MTSPVAQAQDPDELFDVLDGDGNPTGTTKRRADVHRDGDWHRAIHVWIWGVDDTGPYLLLNQRGRDKDTWPLAFDATVGGHLGAGESVEDAFREIREEVGVEVDAARLVYLGQRMRSSGDLIPGVLDQEVQAIYLLRDSRPYLEFRPNPAELEGLVRISLGGALALFSGQTDRIRGTRLRAHDRRFDYVAVRAEDLVCLPTDDYFLRVAESIFATMHGEPVKPL